MNKYEALIQWISPEVGGRVPASKEHHSVRTEFEEHEGDFWILEVRVGNPIEAGMGLWLADVWFFAKNAPQSWLKPGARFRFFERRKVIGVGQCIHRFTEIP